MWPLLHHSLAAEVRVTAGGCFVIMGSPYGDLVVLVLMLVLLVTVMIILMIIVVFGMVIV